MGLSAFNDAWGGSLGCLELGTTSMIILAGVSLVLRTDKKIRSASNQAKRDQNEAKSHKIITHCKPFLVSSGLEIPSLDGQDVADTTCTAREQRSEGGRVGTEGVETGGGREEVRREKK